VPAEHVRRRPAEVRVVLAVVRAAPCDAGSAAGVTEGDAGVLSGDDVGAVPAPNRPFRWNLVEPDQLGSLLNGCVQPDLWYLDARVACSARVIARSANGHLYFVGRSADSIYDLLAGALADTSWRDRLFRLPLSLRWEADDLSAKEVEQLGPPRRRRACPA